jgi:hypothetical protein
MHMRYLELLGLLNKGITPACTLTRARILLAADEHKTDDGIAASLHVHPAPVERPRRRLVEGRATRASTRSTTLVVGPSSIPSRKHFWPRSSVGTRRQVEDTGRCRCWPTAWSNSGGGNDQR